MTLAENMGDDTIIGVVVNTRLYGVPKITLAFDNSLERLKLRTFVMLMVIIY